MANLTGIRGDTFNLPFSLTTGTSPAAINLSGATVFFTMKERLSDSDAVAPVKKQTPAASGITVVSTGNGTVSVNIGTGDSALFKTGPYHYGLQVRTATDTVYTTTTGLFNVQGDFGLRADVPTG